MPNMKIGRYSDVQAETGGQWSGWVEPDDRSWIIWLDATGKPALYWPERDADGGVIGDPVVLADTEATAGYR